MSNEHNEDEKITLNEITVRARIYDIHKPYLEDKSFGFDFRYGNLPQKQEDIAKQLDKSWEQLKSQIIKEMYGE